jgi:hypothetical protein
MQDDLENTYDLCSGGSSNCQPYPGMRILG